MFTKQGRENLVTRAINPPILETADVFRSLKYNNSKANLSLLPDKISSLKV